MPELRPDEARLGLQGQVGQLTSPPPMPQANTFVPSAENSTRGQFGVMTSRLGDVISAQALERQRLMNQAMISNALLSAQSGMDDLYNRQIQRKGFNVMAMPATDTEDAKDDIVTTFGTGTSQLVSSINGKFTNEYQREMFNRTFAPILVAKADQLQQYYHTELRQATQKSQDASLQLLANDAVGYINEGNYEKAQLVFNGAEQVIASANEMNGGSDASRNQLTSNFYDNTLPKVFASLNEQERYGEMSTLYERFGNKMTGQAKLEVARMVGSGSLIGRAKDVARSIWQEHINDPMAHNADGSINFDYLSQFGRDAANRVTYVDYKTTSTSGAVTDQSLYLKAVTAGIVGSENSSTWTEENADTKAYGMYQIMPENITKYAAELGLTEAEARTPEGQARIKNAMLQDGIEAGMDTPEKLLIYWFSGKPDWANEFVNDPENPKWKDKYRYGDNYKSVYDYVKDGMEAFNSFMAHNSQQAKAPKTYDMPMQAGMEDAGLSNTDAGMVATLPYVGGILVDILGTSDGLQITSGWRSLEYNASPEVNGVEDSYHLKGNAVDIYVPNLTPELENTITSRLSATGMYEDVLFHDAGSGRHLHLENYQGNLGEWLKKGGYTQTTSTQRVRYDVRDRRYEDAILSELEQLARNDQSTQNWEMGQIINRYSQQDWTGRAQDLEQALKGETIGGRPLTPVQMRNILSQVEGYNAGTTRRQDTEVRWSDSQRQRAMARQAQADRTEAAMNMYYNDMLNGNINSFEELKNKPYYANMPPQTKFMLYSQFKSGTGQMASQTLGSAMDMAKSRITEQYGTVDPYVTYSTQEYLAGKINEYSSKYGGKMPPPFILSNMVDEAIAQSPNAQTTNPIFGRDKFSDTNATDWAFSQGGDAGGVSGGRINGNGRRYWNDVTGEQTPLTWDETSIGSGWTVANPDN